MGDGLRVTVSIDEVTLGTVVEDVYAPADDDWDDDDPRAGRSVTIGDLVADRIAEAVLADSRWAAKIAGLLDERADIVDRVAAAVAESLRALVMSEAEQRLRQVGGVSMVRGQDSTAVRAMVATAVDAALREAVDAAVAQITDTIPGEIAALVEERIRETPVSRRPGPRPWYGPELKTSVRVTGIEQVDTFVIMCAFAGRRPHEMAADIVLEAIRAGQENHEIQAAVKAARRSRHRRLVFGGPGSRMGRRELLRLVDDNEGTDG